MSKKINIEVPEIFAKMIEKKRVEAAEAGVKKTRAQEEAISKDRETLKAYSAALSWATTEDGVVDIEIGKQNLIALAKQYQTISAHGSPVWEVSYGTSGNRASFSPGYSRLKEQEDLLKLGYSEEDILSLQQVVEAWDLLKDTFEDFNKFTDDLWKEEASNILYADKVRFDEAIARRNAVVYARKQYLKPVIDQAKEERLVAFLKTDAGQGKVKLPRSVAREIELDILENDQVMMEGFAERVERDFEKSIEDGKLSQEEMVGVIGRLR